MELEGVVRGEADVEALGVELVEGVPVVVEEERVVAQRRHRDPNLNNRPASVVVQERKSRGVVTWARYQRYCRTGTLRRRRPWAMDSARRKPDTRCPTAPASPQCGRSDSRFMPRSLHSPTALASLQTGRDGKRRGTYLRRRLRAAMLAYM